MFARSEGNPFFTEELLQAMRPGSGALPETLRDLLQGRVEALPEPARHVLGVAAVAGRRVPHRLLAAVAGLSDQEQTEALRVAVAHQLLVTRPGEDGYEFRHALLQEAVYTGLLPGERAGAHATLATAIAAHPDWTGGTAVTVAAVLLQCRAEQTRLHGPADPAAWAAAAARWEALGRPYPAACARFREAEALLASGAPRARVEEAVQAAHEVASRLGTAPLRGELELLARRGRLRLQAPPQQARAAEPDGPSAARSLGLTRRELEVLELVAAGRSNRQIGEELFITPKTAGLHVSRILAKLGVAGRGEAAAVAHRLGIGR